MRAADGRVPVTVKMRKGIDDDHLTYLDAGRIAQDAGVAWVALHGRTAAQLYAGRADWDAIGDLAAALDVPVLGNGDLWEAADALRMMARTGCAGVVVGRGCLGRPWLFGDLAAAFGGRPDAGGPAGAGRGGRGDAPPRRRCSPRRWPTRTAAAATSASTSPGTSRASASARPLRSRLGMVSSLAELDDLLGELELDQEFPDVVLGSPRGRTTGVRAVSLPDRWLDDPESDLVPAGAELAHSGG